MAPVSYTHLDVYKRQEASSQALDQLRLWGLTFEVGVFTNLTQDHLDYHKMCIRDRYTYLAGEMEMKTNLSAVQEYATNTLKMVKMDRCLLYTSRCV